MFSYGTTVNGFAYVIVPEFHKDGAIHFHGLCKLGTMRLERAVNARTGQPMSTEKGQPMEHRNKTLFAFL